MLILANALQATWLVLAIAISFQSFSSNAWAESSSGVTNMLPQALPLQREGDVPNIPFGFISICVILIILAAGFYFFVFSRNKSSLSTKQHSTNSKWWLQLTGNFQSAKQLQVISTVRLSHQATLHDVVWRGKRFLLASSHQGIWKLDESPELSTDIIKDPLQSETV